MALDFAKGIATGVVSSNLRRVSGNIPGLLGSSKGGKDTSKYQKLNRNHKFWASGARDLDNL